jgi:undecaprenyl pyrophosphate phosphatase UppP
MHEGLYFLLHGPTVLVLGLYFLKPWWNYLVGFVQLKQSAVQMIVCVIVADLVTVGFYCGLKLMGNPDVPLTIGFLITTSALVSLRFMPNEPGLPRFARNDDGERHSCDENEEGCLCGFNNKVKSCESSNDNLNYCNCSMVNDNVSSLRAKRGNPGDNEKVNLVHGLVLGAVQGLALLPGISRFAITFAAARWLGWSPGVALERSFLIQWPLILAGFLKGVWWVSMRPEGMQLLRAPQLFSILIATMMASCGLLLVAHLVKIKRLWIFSFYTGGMLIASAFLGL